MAAGKRARRVIQSLSLAYQYSEPGRKFKQKTPTTTEDLNHQDTKNAMRIGLAARRQGGSRSVPPG